MIISERKSTVASKNVLFLPNTMCYLKGYSSSFCVPIISFLLYPLLSKFHVGLKQILHINQHSSPLSSASPETWKLGTARCNITLEVAWHTCGMDWLGKMWLIFRQWLRTGVGKEHRSHCSPFLAQNNANEVGKAGRSRGSRWGRKDYSENFLLVTENLPSLTNTESITPDSFD